MKRGLIVAAGTGVAPPLLRRLADESDIVAAVDGGYRFCLGASVCPDMLLGDFDSLGAPPAQEGLEVVRLPCEKDDTDTLFAMRRLLALGCADVTLCCALGGRLDHTLANLQALLFLLAQGASGRLVDENTCAQAYLPGEIELRREGYALFSLFPLGGVCEGVTIEGAKYPLSGYRLENTYPIGISNVFLGETARVRFLSGQLLVIRCRADDGGADGAK